MSLRLAEARNGKVWAMTRGYLSLNLCCQLPCRITLHWKMRRANIRSTLPFCQSDEPGYRQISRVHGKTHAAGTPVSSQARRCHERMHAYIRRATLPLAPPRPISHSLPTSYDMRALVMSHGKSFTCSCAYLARLGSQQLGSIIAPHSIILPSSARMNFSRYSLQLACPFLSSHAVAIIDASERLYQHRLRRRLCLDVKANLASTNTPRSRLSRTSRTASSLTRVPIVSAHASLAIALMSETQQERARECLGLS